MPAKKAKQPARLTPAQEDSLAELQELLAPNVASSIATLIELKDDPTVRCATRERAASRILTMYYNTITLPARLASEMGDESEGNSTIVVVNQSDIEDATARAQAARLARLALARQNQS